MAGSEELKERIIQLFREQGTPSNDGNGLELPLKDIWQSLNVEKKAVNRILHDRLTRCFTKVKDSPPLWQYKDENAVTTVTSPLVTPSAAAGAALNVSTDTQPDVVVKKKEEVTLDSPSKKEKLKPLVLSVLRESTVPLLALQIAKNIDYTTAGDVNPTLYALRDEGKVTKLEDKWMIPSTTSNVSSLSAATQDLCLDSTPMQLDGKKLYTKEDVVQDGRHAHIFYEVLTGDVQPKKSESKDEVDVSNQAGSASTKAGPLDDEMLGLISSLFDDSTESDLALKIVNILRTSGDTPLDDVDIFTKLNYSTRSETKPILDSLKLNGLVERIEGDVVKWKWKAFS